MAIYGFARLADELGDEASGDRLAQLDALEGELDQAFAGRARHPLLRRLTPALRERELPREPFVKLIEANRRDQTVHRYPSFEALCGYCALSADPVGELVLRVFGAPSPENLRLSDAICTALQLVEHLQDVAEDHGRGRVYLPAEDLEREGCREEELDRAPATPALRRVVASLGQRARALLGEGEPLVGRLKGAPRLAVAAFAGGGHAALDAVARANFDVTSARRAPRRRDLLQRTLGLLWRAGLRSRGR